ncbi:MAG: hypothetical protein P8Y80_16680 [Acidobacteriota bacterium]|jgi:opacity protein-like surface antigen
MKKSILLLMGIFILLCGSAFAQDDYPKAEVFGGFSILSVGSDEDVFSEREQFYGFQANAAFNVSENFGAVADFGGQYKNIEDITAHVYEYVFGPRFSLRGEKATVFGQALFGGATLGGGGESINGFAMGFGGGVDVNVSERLAVRVVQFDWIPTRFEGEWNNNTVRFGFGIVIK